MIAMLVYEPLLHAPNHVSLRCGETIFVDADAELEPELFPIPFARSATAVGLGRTAEVLDPLSAVDLQTVD
jgi:hypothetical protein